MRVGWGAWDHCQSGQVAPGARFVHETTLYLVRTTHAPRTHHACTTRARCLQLIYEHLDKDGDRLLSFEEMHSIISGSAAKVLATPALSSTS